jgi:VWFA-related protein
MLFSLPSVCQPGPRWPSKLSAVILTLLAVLAPSTLKAQTAASQEISSRDVEPTFKLQTERNLVMVRVVVRNAKGATVDSLRQEDFQLFDHGKLQAILHFSLEKPALKATEPLPLKPAEKSAATEPEGTGETPVPGSAPHRFLAFYFDDVNTPFENMARARDAADHFVASSMQPGDRVALFTASGQMQLDFTDNFAEIHQALLDLRPRPVIVGKDETCDALPPYQAYLIINRRDDAAMAEATEETLNCHFNGDVHFLRTAQGKVQSNAAESLAHSETQTTAALRGIESVVRRMTSMPGQRIVVIVSEGFLTESFLSDLGQIADRALRGGVILNAIDARGLYARTPITDANVGHIAATSSATFLGQKVQMIEESAIRQAYGMQSLAFDTGGVFFSNSNDLEAGFRKAADLPEAFYVLAFSPPNLKLDGAFHPIQVKLASARGLSVQARRGYYAPMKSNDPGAREKEEIQEAVYSQDETHDLPIDVHTQFFMKSESDARVAVQTSIDVRQLRLRKEGDRNLDNLTFVTVVFDRDGHVVSGQQRSVELRLRDSSLENFLQSGITIRTLFDVKPGNYLVREIVRDSESGQISGLNRTVEIPY